MKPATLTVLTLAAAAALAALACDDEPAAEAGASDIVDAWKRAGMTPSELAPLDSADLAGGTCQAGRVDGLHVIVCTYPTDDAALAARDAGLAVVGKATGAALPSGSRLLIVADRDNVDPSGRRIQKLTKTYLDASKPATSLL